MAAMTCVIGHMAACEVAWDTWQPVRWHRTCVKGTHDSWTTCQFMDLVSMQPTIIQGNPTPLSNWKLSITFQRRRDSHFPTQDFPSPPFLFREEGLVNQKAYKRRVPHLITQAFHLHRKAGAILPLQPLDIYIPWRHSHALKTNSLACILLGSPHLHKGLHFMFIIAAYFSNRLFFTLSNIVHASSHVGTALHTTFSPRLPLRTSNYRLAYRNAVKIYDI